MQVLLKGNGEDADSPLAVSTPLLMHNERLADPLDSMTIALAEITGIRKKTQADHYEIARREFYGGLYTNPIIEWPPPYGDSAEVVLPAWNVLRCLQEGAKRNKRGVNVLRGCSPLSEFATFIHSGPTDLEELYKDKTYQLRKSVGVQRAKTMRTRPIFRDWGLELLIEVDPVIWDIGKLAQDWHDAGLYAGLGDMRPVYGKFHATLEEIKVQPVPLKQPGARSGRGRKAA